MDHQNLKELAKYTEHFDFLVFDPLPTAYSELATTA